LIHECHPRIVLLVGIAAGMKKGTKIGTVILSERVWDYETEALVTGPGGQIEHSPRPNVGQLSFERRQEIISYLISGLSDRINQRFNLMGGTYPKLKPSTPKRSRKPTIVTRPEVEQATVASGNKLLRNPRFLYALQNVGHGRIKVGEMEAAGLFTACHQEKTDWLVVRSVSDFGDRSKNDEYHRFA